MSRVDARATLYLALLLAGCVGKVTTGVSAARDPNSMQNEDGGVTTASNADGGAHVGGPTPVDAVDAGGTAAREPDATVGSTAADSGLVVVRPPDVTPVHTVGACDKLAGLGTWENMTPPGLDLSGFGAATLSLSAQNSGVLYLGTSNQGIYKTVNCGSTWVKINTGTLSADIDKGTALVVLDPIDENVVYASSLYGTNGYFKSTNGGVDFRQILSPEVVKYAPYGGFVGHSEMDPNDHLHLLVAWHQECSAPYTKACYAETKDGGATWTMRDGDASWAGGEGTALQFLDSNSWLFSSSSNGMWRTADRGATWAKLPNTSVSHGSGQLYHGKNGYYVGTVTGVAFSADGVLWSLLADSGQLIAGVTGDGESIWTGSAFPYNPDSRPSPYLPYKRATESEPNKWSTLDSPKLTSGGNALIFDPDHKVLYSSNFWEGVWRVVIK